MRSAILIAILFVLAISCSSHVSYLPQNGPAPVPGAININTATVDEIERLPHIGRKTAESIIEFRTVNGPFRRVESLMQIRGLSDARFAELRPYIRVE